MLFMGSERFPDENEYDAFLTAQGGSSNAQTEEVRGEQIVHSRSQVCALR